MSPKTVLNVLFAFKATAFFNLSLISFPVTNTFPQQSILV
jgi:hypothetical protein